MLKHFDEPTERDIQRNRLFHDLYLVAKRFKNLPGGLSPIIGVFCRNKEDLEFAKLEAPSGLDIHYSGPGTISLEQNLVDESSVESELIEKTIDDIEKMFGYHKDKSKRTEDYSEGRAMIRKALQKAYNVKK